MQVEMTCHFEADTFNSSARISESSFTELKPKQPLIEMIAS